MGEGREQKPQLWMVWPPERPVPAAALSVQSPYTIRLYRPGDDEAFLGLMAETDFDPWDERKLAYNIGRIIPDGWFMAVERGSDKIVATAMCLHNYCGDSPFTGDVGWLACQSRHRGRGLGLALTARVVARFIQAGYSRIQLHTEHYRLAAIKIYLKLGFLPVLASSELRTLWAEVCLGIGHSYTPDDWPVRA